MMEPATPYQILLNQEEWKEKRKLIIERDQYRCNVCGNKNILIDLEYHILIRGVTRNSVSYNSIHTKGRFILIEPSSGKDPMYVYFLPKDINLEKLFLSYAAKTDFEDLKQFMKTSKDLSLYKKWIDFRGLHVHHTYYKYGLLPWEYPSESLQTLCGICHEDLHKSTEIPVYDSNGNLIEYKLLKTCPRCLGAGIFPEYKHVYNGFCFQCDGRRYIDY